MKRKALYLLLTPVLLLVISCHKGKDYTPTLIGKWRSAKPKIEEAIAEMKKENQARGLPEQLFQPTMTN
jgi:hypothetical protein